MQTSTTAARLRVTLLGVLLLCTLAAAVVAEVGQLREQPFSGDLNQPAIGYNTLPLTDRLSQLQQQLDRGDMRLAFDAATGYLPAVLAALQVPVASQILVFSKTGV